MNISLSNFLKISSALARRKNDFVDGQNLLDIYRQIISFLFFSFSAFSGQPNNDEREREREKCTLVLALKDVLAGIRNFKVDFISVRMRRRIQH
jgi:hypothetical protein